MLFSKWAWDGLARGEITVTFRRWTRPQAKAGGSYRTPAGMIHVTSAAEVPLRTITATDARRAGFATKQALLDHLGAGPSRVWRIEFTFAGDDPRVELRNTVPATSDEIVAIVKRLDRLDRASPRGPWTRTTLQLINDRPATRAKDLAESQGRDMPSFKIDVRKLKAIGLTESLERGYRLSPRGEAVLRHL